MLEPPVISLKENQQAVMPQRMNVEHKPSVVYEDTFQAALQSPGV